MSFIQRKEPSGPPPSLKTNEASGASIRNGEPSGPPPTFKFGEPTGASIRVPLDQPSTFRFGESSGAVRTEPSIPPPNFKVTGPTTIREPSGPPPNVQASPSRSAAPKEPSGPPPSSVVKTVSSLDNGRSAVPSSSIPNIRVPAGPPPILAKESAGPPPSERSELSGNKIEGVRQPESHPSSSSLIPQQGVVEPLPSSRLPDLSQDIASVISTIGRNRFPPPSLQDPPSSGRKRSQRHFEDEVTTREEQALEPDSTSRDQIYQQAEDGEPEEEEEEEGEFKFEPAKFVSVVVEDEHKLAQRQKQIDMGKNTVGYQNYTENVPRHARQRFNKIHPVTPDIKDATLSKRQFDGQVRAWRRQLHFWDVLPGQPLPSSSSTAGAQQPPKPFIPHHIRQMNKKMKIMAAKESRMETEKPSSTVSGASDGKQSAETQQSESSLFDDVDF